MKTVFKLNQISVYFFLIYNNITCQEIYALLLYTDFITDFRVVMTASVI
jgi:hypothetical protein